MLISIDEMPGPSIQFARRCREKSLLFHGTDWVSWDYLIISKFYIDTISNNNAVVIQNGLPRAGELELAVQLAVF